MGGHRARAAGRPAVRVRAEGGQDLRHEKAVRGRGPGAPGPGHRGRGDLGRADRGFGRAFRHQMSLSFGTSEISPISMFASLGATPIGLATPESASAPLTHDDGCRRWGALCLRQISMSAAVRHGTIVGSRGAAECAYVDLRGRLSQGSHRHGVAAGRQPSTALSPISPAPLVFRRLGSARWPRGARGTSWLGTCSRAPRGIGHRHRGAVGSACARSSCRHVRHASLADRSVDGVSGQRCARRTRCHRVVHGRRTRRFVLGS